MRLLSREQIESLAKFKSENFLTTSFYFDTDKSRLTKKEITVSLKNLLNRNNLQLEQMDLSKRKKESLNRDLKKIDRFCSQNLNSYNFPGLAIFSCSSQDFWQLFNLPSCPRNRIIFDKNPYVRTLSAILNEHNRICVLTLNRKEAKWYDVSAGDISLLETKEGDVPSKVREGGWEGYESKRIERHIAAHLYDYFKNVAKTTFALLKNNNFDWLFLGCKDEYFADLEPQLHPYLKNKLRGRLKIKPNDSPDIILKESLDLERSLKKQDQDDIVRLFNSELEKGGLAVSGLKNTLQRLNQGEVQTLLITRNFSKPGRFCPKCNLLYLDETRCPTCQKKTEPVKDVIDEAVESAMDKKCQVKHFNSSQLRRYGDIGATLRYKS